MTVKELIQKLSLYEDDMEVVKECYHNAEGGLELTDLDIEEGSDSFGTMFLIIA